jgi:hypothetical protein
MKKLSIHVKDGISTTVENSNCISDKNVAIIIPHRNRLPNLKIFLNNMIPLLTKQKINFGIYVVEPLENIEFNRALLFNVGFLESIKMGNLYNFTWDCFIFHDTDMLPEDVFTYSTKFWLFSKCCIILIYIYIYRKGFFILAIKLSQFTSQSLGKYNLF